jgi:hypothetical protein
MFVFGLLAWVYVVVIQVTHPEWLPGPLSHYQTPPLDWRVDDIGLLAFAISAFGFLVWRLDKKASIK